MHGDMFDTTLPAGEPELLRASAFERYLQDLDGEDSVPNAGISSRISQLNPTLRDDLLRFERAGSGSEALEVVAACLRHATRLTIHLQCDDRVLPLTVFAPERLVHCPVPMEEVVFRHLPQWRVMHLEPAVLRPPGDPERPLVGAAELHHPIEPLLWQLAMRGQRRELLPEIAGPAVYRTAPGLEIETLPARGALMAAVRRLAREPVSLRELANWPGLDRDRASRLLNALYLLSGLIVSRAHPAAGGERRPGSGSR